MANVTNAERRVASPAEYAERKRELSEKNSVVKKPLPRIDDNIVKRKKTGGRKKKYTPTRMKNEINKYFEWCEEQDEMPSIKGMMIHLKLYKDMFYKYLTYPEFSDIMEHARMIIADWAEQDVYNTKGMAAGKIAYMKNVHGWADKLETQNYTEQKVMTVDAARQRIEQLAPKLLELLKSHQVVNQIGHIEDAEIIDGEG